MPTASRSIFFGYSPQRYTRLNPRELGFEDTQGYDQGRVPACAINTHNRVVELHTGDSSSSLNLRIAEVDGVSLNWLGHGQTLAETGQNPSIALSNDNDVIVMYDKGARLHYRLGTLHIDTSGRNHVYEVQFVPSKPDTAFPDQTDSTDPSVALSTSGDVLELHVRTGRQLYWRRGKLSAHALTWNNTDTSLVSAENVNEFTGTENPSVAVNDKGRAVAVFQKGQFLYYSVGVFTPGGAVTDPVAWTAPTRFHRSGGGHRPSVALNNDNEVIVVFEESSNLVQGFGRLGSDNTITFAEPLLPGKSFYVYDKGISPQVATNGSLAVQVFNQGNNRLRGNAALIFGHASWMSDHHDQLITKTLADVVPPASHDSGAFAHNDAQTQDLSIRRQLLYGVRYFDIRPNYDGDKDAAIDEEKLVTYHDLGLESLATIYDGPKLKDVISRVRLFMEAHNELVILKLSHFRNFNDDVYSKLIDLIKGNGTTTGLTKWLYKPKAGETRRLAHLPLRQFLKRRRGTVLVLIDRVSNFIGTNSSAKHPKLDSEPDVQIDFFNDSDRNDGFFRYRDWYDPKPEEDDITVFDLFSDTVLFDRMALNEGYSNDSGAIDTKHPDIPGSTTRLPRAQLLKFKWFDGLCQGRGSTRSVTPCDLFLLSWTLTPNSAATRTAFQRADEATEHLVPYLNIPKYNMRNDQGYRINLLFTDAVEFSRSTDLAMLRNGLA